MHLGKRYRGLLWVLLLCPLILHSDGADRNAARPADEAITTEADLFCEWGVLVPVRLNGAGTFSMIIDSGAGISTLSLRAARELGLQLGPSRRSRGAGENTYDLFPIQAPIVEANGRGIRVFPVFAAGLETTEETAGTRLDGILGNDLFRHYVVGIDYAERKVTLMNPDNFSYSGSGTVLPLEIKNQLLFTTAVFDADGASPKQVRLLVDTGGFGVSLILNTPFVQANALGRSGMLENHSGFGQGGTVHVLLTRAERLQLGGISLRHLIVALSKDSGGALAASSYDGILGGEVLRRFRVIFDLARLRLILEPNPQLQEPFNADHSGIALLAKDLDCRRLEIYSVMSPSPAEQAGIQPGDYMESIDDQPVCKFTLAELPRMLRDGTRSYTLVIRHRNRLRKVRLKLRELV